MGLRTNQRYGSAYTLNPDTSELFCTSSHLQPQYRWIFTSPWDVFPSMPLTSKQGPDVLGNSFQLEGCMSWHFLIAKCRAVLL